MKTGYQLTVYNIFIFNIKLCIFMDIYLASVNYFTYPTCEK